MDQKLTPQQMVIWTANAKPREQIFMLRLMDVYGTKRFTATIQEIAQITDMSIGTTIRCLTGVRDLGWLDSARVYKKTGKNLPSVTNCEYIVTIKNEPDQK